MKSEDSSSYRRQNNEMFIHELEQNSINPNRYDGHGQQDEILDDKHFLLPMSYTEGKHVPLMDSKLRHSKPQLQGEEKKLYFLAKYLEQISDENVAMGFLTRFENCEATKKGSEEGDSIIAALIEMKVSQRILRNVLGIGFHRYNRISRGEAPKKKGKKNTTKDCESSQPAKIARIIGDV
jgi:hypothetical protein